MTPLGDGGGLYDDTEGVSGYMDGTVSWPLLLSDSNPHLMHLCCAVNPEDDNDDV